MKLILAITLFFVFLAFAIVFYRLTIFFLEIKKNSKTNKIKPHYNDPKSAITNENSSSSVFSTNHAFTQPLSSYDDLLLLNYLHNQNGNEFRDNDTKSKEDIIGNKCFDDFSSIKTTYQEKKESGEKWMCHAHTSNQPEDNNGKNNFSCRSDFSSRDDDCVSGGNDNSSNQYND